MTTRADWIHALRYEVGTVERPANSNCQPYSHELGRPCESWCADFLAAIATRVKLDVPSHAAYTPTVAGAFKTAGQWHVDDPEPGDYVFYDFPDALDRIQHVGVVVGVEPMLIHTVEGNTSPDDHGSQYNGGGVYERTRHRNASIVGYGRPIFTTGDDDLTLEEHNLLTELGKAQQNVNVALSNILAELHTIGEGIQGLNTAISEVLKRLPADT